MTLEQDHESRYSRAQSESNSFQDELRAAIDQGEPQTELLVLLELTRSRSQASKWASGITGPNLWDHSFTDEDIRSIRDELHEALMSRQRQQPQSNSDLDDLLDFDELLDLAGGERLSPVYHDLAKKEMGVQPDTVNWTGAPPEIAKDLRVGIIGAGPSGITSAIRMKHLDLDFTIFDSAEDFGGTWLHNTYPGCGVDIASHYFSFSYDQKSDWSRYYAKQPEILDYLQGVAERAKLHANARFGTEVVAARFDESAHQWELTVHSKGGEVSTERVDILITAVGLLSSPKIPDFPGLAKFQGKYFHAAQWDHTVDYKNKRVALVGTGASANQIGPTIAPDVDELVVIQRSAQWNVAVENYMKEVSDGEKWLLANIPEYQRWFRTRTMLSQNDSLRPAAEVDPEWSSSDGSISAENARLWTELTQYIKDELGDRQDLLPIALPDYPPFTKRMLRDNGWYRMMRRDNVDVVPGREVQFTSDGIVDANGKEHKVDIVVFATGFEASRALGSLQIEGRTGRTIRDVWGEDDPRAHLGITVPGFPNMFVMYGPNTNIGTGGSIILQAETWTRYAAEAIVKMVEANAVEIECKPEAMDEYNRAMDARLAEMIWAVSSGSTWYRNSAGRVVSNMPWSTPEYWNLTRQVKQEDYTLRFSNEDRSGNEAQKYRPSGKDAELEIEAKSL